MMRLLASLAAGLRRFRRREDGNGTIEFVLVLPGFLLLFTSAYEGGVLSTRHVMLERGLDVTVREIRIGKIPFPTHENLVDRICDVASIIPDCTNQLRLEMINRNPRDWQTVSRDVQCIDREEEGVPVLNPPSQDNNELMILRVCALFDPMIPTNGLGKEIPKESGGAYALVATSSYVMEPFK